MCTGRLHRSTSPPVSPRVGRVESGLTACAFRQHSLARIYANPSAVSVKCFSGFERWKFECGRDEAFSAGLWSRREVRQSTLKALSGVRGGELGQIGDGGSARGGKGTRGNSSFPRELARSYWSRRSFSFLPRRYGSTSMNMGWMSGPASIITAIHSPVPGWNPSPLATASSTISAP